MSLKRFLATGLAATTVMVATTSSLVLAYSRRTGIDATSATCNADAVAELERVQVSWDTNREKPTSIQIRGNDGFAYNVKPTRTDLVNGYVSAFIDVPSDCSGLSFANVANRGGSYDTEWFVTV